MTNYSPEQKICISCLLLWVGNSSFLLRRVIWHLLVKIPSETKPPIEEKIIKMLLRKGFGTILNRRGGCAGAGHKRSRFYQAANLATATINIARCTIAECKHAQTLIKLGRCKPYYSHVVYSNGLRPLEQPRRTAQELGQCF